MNQATTLMVTSSWEELFHEEHRSDVEAILPNYLPARRWFSDKARTIESVRIVDAILLPLGPSNAYLTMIKVEYSEGKPQTYVLPVTFAEGARAMQIENRAPQAIVARVQVEGAGADNTSAGMLYDATWDGNFATTLLEAICQGSQFPAASGEIKAWASDTSGEALQEAKTPLESRIMGAEQSNTSLVYGDRFILKLFRRLEGGTSPDLEIGRFLVEKGFSHTPPVLGAIEQHRREGEPLTLAILQGYVHNKGDAWQYSLDALEGYFSRVEERKDESENRDIEATPTGHLLDLLGKTPAGVREAIGPYLESASLLGRRTAEMHLAMASDHENPAFAPESFSMVYQTSLYDSVMTMYEEAIHLLSGRLNDLSGAAQLAAQGILDSREELRTRLQPMLEQEIPTTRTRVHGDYHLGQVLYTGDDFMIIDFEGEPARQLSERRCKHSPLKDVAGMLRSFHYAANAAAMSKVEDVSELPGHADAWYRWVSVAYLEEYLKVAGPADFLPRAPEEIRLLLDVYLLEKATYELLYELNNRPDWVRIPLQGITQLIT
ncbi:MAG: putative maltokinase [Chloroflexota bacterium]|nr:putative maltokinase [Chloroflexota bacterium]